MKPIPDDSQIVRWVDGEMNEAERLAFESQLESAPDLRAELDSLRKLGDALRKNIPAERELPYADFFNSQIQVRISREDLDVQRGPRQQSGAGGWMGWLRMPWLAAAAAAVVVVLGILTWQNQTDDIPDTSSILSSYVPNQDVQAHVVHSEDAGAVVLMLDGLAEIPADRKIVGFHVHRTETDQEIATTTLFSRDGKVLVVLAKDGRNQPQMWDRSPRG